jgi:molecular chaperone IbpA
LLNLKGDIKMTNAQRMTADLLNDPFFIGFDRVLHKMQNSTPGQTNYPPYNIVKLDEDRYTIELAVAGFDEDEIDVSIKEGVLEVIAEKATHRDEGEYLHKGISARAFRRAFTLSDTIIVNGADLVNGILSIELENVIPEEKKPRKINIGKQSASGKKTLLTE